MSARTRLVLGLVSLIVLGALLLGGLHRLPRFGHYTGIYGRTLARVAVKQRVATDVVNTVTFDYRGIDTLGEEFILFAASVGLVVLLRTQRGERRDEREDDEDPGASSPLHDRLFVQSSPALRAFGLALIAPLIVLGVYVVSHGSLTPGGGFQGGVVLAAALITVYLAGRYAAVARVRPIPLVELAEGAGAGGFVAIAVGGLLAGASFMSNFLPLGQSGDLLSGGFLPPLSVSVGLEVAGSLTLVISEFLDQRLLRSAERLSARV